MGPPLAHSPHLAIGTSDLNQNQRDHNHKVATDKPEEKKDREKDYNTGVPPERLGTQNEKDTRQEPPPLTAAAKKLINDDIRGSTKKTYNSNVKAFATICGYHSPIAIQHIGVGGTSLGILPEIKQLARAIFTYRLPLPRYSNCWDVNRVLEYLETGPSLTDLSDMDLSVKTATINFILTLSGFDNMNGYDFESISQGF